MLFFFKQKTAYEMRISDWSSDVCSSDLTAAEIAPEWHLRMQAAVQNHVDAAVSKTVNLPVTATVDDVRAIYLAAWKAKVKGITVYQIGRASCRERVCQYV